METKQLVYHFIDGRLYQITVWIPHDGYHKLHDAMISKYGPASSQSSSTYQNSFGASFIGDILRWNNEVSGITLTERCGQLDTSCLVYVLFELQAVAIEPEPPPNADDL